MIDVPWYRWPARFVCLLFGHDKSRQAHYVKPYKGSDWMPVPPNDTVLICSRCHVPLYMAPNVTRWLDPL